MNEIRQYKTSCLLAEHQTLSGFVEQEVVATALLRGLAGGSWLVAVCVGLGAGVASPALAVAVVGALAAFWLADVYFSYVGVVYKVRRLAVREHLEALPATSDAAVAGWKTPVNPFDGLTRAGKLGALRDALTSPAVFAAYALLGGVTFVVLLVR